MADETIQDDHPELPPRAMPKPEREPIVIEGEATDVTPPEAEPAPLESLGEAIAEEPASEPHAAAEAEHEPAPAADDEPAAPAAPAVAEHEAAVAHEAAAEPKPAEPAAAPPGGYEPPTAPRSGLASAARFLAYAAILVVIVVVALFVGAYVHNPFTEAMKNSDDRIGAIDAALKTEVAARSALEARVAATEAKVGQLPAPPKLDALEARLAKLESAVASTKAPAAAEAKSTPAPAAAAPPTPVAQATAPASSPADGALAARVAKLEAALAAPKPEPAPNPEIATLSSGQSALGDRIAKLEAALAAQKSVARAEPTALAKGLDPVAEAVAAISLAQRLSEGEPYAAEFAALAKAGADAGALSALKPYADAGAPTPEKLSVAFDKLTPALSASVKSDTKDKIVDQMMDQLRGLVKVRVVGEVQGEDPTALISQVSAALARDDIAGALATEAKLPAAAQAVAAGWVKDAAGLQNATSAARSLAETALKRFAEAKN